MDSFENGDLVYHAHHGAGTVISTQEVDIAGSTRLYYVVELATGSRLMLPTSQAECMCSLRTSKAIGDVLSATPENLASDYRTRRAGIEQKINSGDQLQSAEVVRDLAWREHKAQLSNTDREFMKSMKRRLVDILSMQTDLNVQEAAQWLEVRLKKLIRARSAREGGAGEAV
jgi:RNA polymerase-interacting CarD/CdnL/TRCF family regulator